MRYASASALLAAALALSLGGKAASLAPAPRPDLRPFQEAASRLLAASGFAVRVESYGPVVGRKGDCRILVGDYSPYGTFDALFKEVAAPVGPLRFAYRGVLHDSPPKALALTEFYLWRELGRIGIRTPRHPVSAAAESPACAAQPLDWAALASLPA
jgi:hypothetical protein